MSCQSSPSLHPSRTRPPLTRHRSAASVSSSISTTSAGAASAARWSALAPSRRSLADHPRGVFIHHVDLPTVNFTRTSLASGQTSNPTGISLSHHAEYKDSFGNPTLRGLVAKYTRLLLAGLKAGEFELLKDASWGDGREGEPMDLNERHNLMGQGVVAALALAAAKREMETGKPSSFSEDPSRRLRMLKGQDAPVWPSPGPLNGESAASSPAFGFASATAESTPFSTDDVWPPAYDFRSPLMGVGPDAGGLGASPLMSSPLDTYGYEEPDTAHPYQRRTERATTSPPTAPGAGYSGGYRSRRPSAPTTPTPTPPRSPAATEGSAASELKRKSSKAELAKHVEEAKIRAEEAKIKYEEAQRARQERDRLDREAKAERDRLAKEARAERERLEKERKAEAKAAKEAKKQRQRDEKLAKELQALEEKKAAAAAKAGYQSMRKELPNPAPSTPVSASLRSHYPGYASNRPPPPPLNLDVVPLPFLTFHVNRQPIKVLIDSGAMLNLVHPHVRDRLQLHTRPAPGQLNGVTGTGACEGICEGGVNGKGVELAAVDPHYGDSVMTKAKLIVGPAGGTADAILGMPWIISARAEISYTPGLGVWVAFDVETASGSSSGIASTCSSNGTASSSTSNGSGASGPGPKHRRLQLLATSETEISRGYAWPLNAAKAGSGSHAATVSAVHYRHSALPTPTPTLPAAPHPAGGTVTFTSASTARARMANLEKRVGGLRLSATTFTPGRHHHGARRRTTSTTGLR